MNDHNSNFAVEVPPIVTVYQSDPSFTGHSCPWCSPSRRKEAGLRFNMAVVIK